MFSRHGQFARLENWKWAIFLRRFQMFDLQHRYTTLVFPESNSYLLNVTAKTKLTKMLPQLYVLERKAKNDPGLKAYFWNLEPSWKL